MLKLKRIELQGFKSFCDKTDLRFNGSGIAAIVGPNGCGKSNIGDAISWVLGEQSAKSLRGARMEDVIFAGTRDRKPLGLASVTMTLVDPSVDPNAPILVPEVNAETPDGEAAKVTEVKAPKKREFTITRRLFRSGESEYLIDGKLARLRDIQDIFMGTGLGPESYAIIEQGRIGQILSSRPMDRRGVIEEAAGITKFKTRRRLAEAKLEGAKQNLSRVFDILEEVNRQVNSLKRQAAKAERYEKLREELVGHMRLAFSGKWKKLEREASKTAIELSQAAGALDEMVRGLTEKEAKHEEVQLACYELEETLTKQRQRLSEVQLEAERTRGKLLSQAQQIAGMEQRLSSGEVESTQLEERLGVLQQELSAHGEQLASAEGSLASLQERLREKNAEREELQNDLRNRERLLEAARQLVLRLLGEGSNLRNQLAQLDEYVAANERDRQRAQKEEQAALADLEQLGAKRDQLQDVLGSRQMELESLADQRKRVEEELSARKSEIQETRRQLEQVRGELSRLKARKDSLEEILSHRAYTTDSVKRLFTAVEQGQTEKLQPVGVLADFIEVDPAYEKATEEFLHEELEYVVVKSWEEAERGIDLMRSDFDGRATFLVHPEPDDAFSGAPARQPAIGPETGIVGRLSDVLKMTNGLTQAPAELLPRLSRCYLVQDRSAAQRLAAQYPDIFFLLPDGVCYHGHAVSGGRKTGGGPLALKRELRELNGLVAQRQRQFEGTTNQIEEFEQQIAALTEEQEMIRQKQQREEREALTLDHEMRKLGEDTTRTNQRLSSARLELQRLAEQLERAESSRLEKQALVEARELARRTEETNLEQGRNQLTFVQEGMQRIGEEHSALRIELASLEERRRSQTAAKQRLEAQIGELSRRRQELAAESERLSLSRSRMLNENMELDASIQLLSEEAMQLDQQVRANAAKDQEMKQALAQIDEALKAERLQTKELQEKKTALEISLVRVQSDLKHLDETSRKELNAAASELLREEDPELDDEALAEVESRYTEVKGRIEALGAVNPAALEEFKEAEQRYIFLNTQRQDLLDSIRDTEKAIQEIDVESRKRFSEAFEAINAHFREMFKTLFGGGMAEMRLTDESNVGESGIEMIASPPGKRLQNVLLLSGGEKSLTAMALLMAIFKYTPSPFCVLDEVDAPLDEANTGRLARLLQEMSFDTQFIVVTHHKRTMEVAQTMYGVTMQEPGVSTLVSVKFNAAMAPPPTPEPRPMAANA